MDMENTEGYEGLQREVEGYEKLRGGSNMYEEIPDSADGYLDPQISSHEIPETAAETDIDGYLKPKKSQEEYDYADNISVQNSQAEYHSSIRSGYEDVINEPLEYDYVQNNNQ